MSEALANFSINQDTSKRSAAPPRGATSTHGGGGQIVGMPSLLQAVFGLPDDQRGILGYIPNSEGLFASTKGLFHNDRATQGLLAKLMNSITSGVADCAQGVQVGGDAHSLSTPMVQSMGRAMTGPDWDIAG